MTKLPSQKLIFSQTLNYNHRQEPTHLSVVNRYRDELSNKKEALNRVRVLTRHLQKSRSDLKNKIKQHDEAEYVHQMANLDRYILRLNSVEQQRSLEKLHDRNIKKRRKRLSQIEQAKLQLQKTHSSAYRSTQRKKIQDERYLIIENQRSQAEKQIHAMRQKIKEKKRATKVLDFYQTKMESIKRTKNKEKRQLMAENERQSIKVESIINKNAKLRLKKERSLKSGFLFETFLDLNNSQSQINPQKPKRPPKVRLIKETIHT